MGKVSLPMENVPVHGKCPCPWKMLLPMKLLPVRGISLCPWKVFLTMEFLPAHGISFCPWNFSLPMEFSLSMDFFPCPWNFSLPMEFLPAHGILPVHARRWNLMISELLPNPKAPKHSLTPPPTLSHVPLTHLSSHTFLLPGIPISQKICW